MAATQKKSADDVVRHVIRHWLRLESLAVLNERVASPNEIAVITRQNVSKVAHHIKELHKAGCVELVDKKQRRGAIEHFYRATKRPEISDEEWQEMTGPERGDIAARVLTSVLTEALASLRAGKLEIDDDLHLVWRVVHLDGEGRQEMKALQAETAREVVEIEARSTSRLAKRGEVGMSTIAAALGFLRSRDGRAFESGDLLTSQG